MEGIGFMILLALLCLLSGPVALIVSLVALKKFRGLERDMYDLAARPARRPGETAAAPTHIRPEPYVPARPEPVKVVEPEVVAETPVTRAAEAPRPAPQRRNGCSARAATCRTERATSSIF